MISISDIEAMQPQLEAADRIVERAKKGVPSGRHIMMNEELPFIQSYVILRETLMEFAEFAAELHAREIEGMSIGPKR